MHLLFQSPSISPICIPVLDADVLVDANRRIDTNISVSFLLNTSIYIRIFYTPKIECFPRLIKKIKIFINWIDVSSSEFTYFCLIE